MSVWGGVPALETALTPALVQEGHARELINRIQNQRKTQDLDVADRIAMQPGHFTRLVVHAVVDQGDFS